MARKQKLTDEQLEQRRKASVAGAAKPHDVLCGCPQCYYKARRVALEGQGESQVPFPIYAAWRAAQELQRAARDQVARDAAQAVEDARVVDNVRVGGAGGNLETEELMPGKAGTRVVTLAPAGGRAGGPPRFLALRVLAIGLLVAVVGFPGPLLGAELHLRESLLAAQRNRVTTTELSPTFSRPTMTGIEHRHAAAGFIPLLTDYPA